MSTTPHDPAAGAEHGDQHLGTDEELVTTDTMGEEFLPDGGVIEIIDVDLASVNPDLADAEQVAQIVAADRTITAKVGTFSGEVELSTSSVQVTGQASVALPQIDQAIAM